MVSIKICRSIRANRIFIFYLGKLQFSSAELESANNEQITNNLSIDYNPSRPNICVRDCKSTSKARTDITVYSLVEIYIYIDWKQNMEGNNL